MDIDSFVALHRTDWDYLEALLRKGSRPRRMSGAELDELVELYQRTATHLSMVRTSFPDPVLVDRLSRLVVRARSTVTGSRDPGWRDLARFFTETFPGAVYARRRWVVGVALGFVAVAVAMGVWVAVSPDIQTAIAPPDEIRQLVDHDFADYYSSAPASSFQAKVFTNNVWVSAAAITLGVVLVPTVYLLFQNAANVGISGGLMASHGKLGLFFGLILPHGLLELTAVFVAAGVGLRAFWSMVDPGPLPRSTALAREARASVGVAMGLVLVLFVSGCLEAFVTPSGWTTWLRVGIGALVEAAFIAYVWVLGRRAVATGHLGDLDEDLAGALLPVA